MRNLKTRTIAALLTVTTLLNSVTVQAFAEETTTNSNYYTIELSDEEKELLQSLGLDYLENYLQHLQETPVEIDESHENKIKNDNDSETVELPIVSPIVENIPAVPSNESTSETEEVIAFPSDEEALEVIELLDTNEELIQEIYEVLEERQEEKIALEAAQNEVSELQQVTELSNSNYDVDNIGNSDGTIEVSPNNDVTQTTENIEEILEFETTNAEVQAENSYEENSTENRETTEIVIDLGSFIFEDETFSDGESINDEIYDNVGEIASIPDKLGANYATSVSLSAYSVSLEVGATYTLKTTIAPSNTTTKTITWKSSNTSVATVSSGKITAKAVGATTITATNAASGKYATCMVLVTPMLVTSISLNSTSKSLAIGKTFDLNETVSPSKAANKTVNWTSSNNNIATVSSSGLVTAKATGSATITVAAKDGSGKTKTCAITVLPIYVSSIALNKAEATVEVGKTVQLSATVSPTNAANKTLTWKSNSTSVATVDANGKVTGVKKGTATITATAADGDGAKATCKITVPDFPVTSVTLNSTSLTLEDNKTAQLTATVVPSNASNKSITWSTSNSKIATIDAGKITAKEVGTATITAKNTTSGKSATCTVTVKPLLAASLKLNATSKAIANGGTYKFTATVSPTNATNKTINWTSSNTNIVTVDSTGKVTAKAIGSATITAATADGSNKIVTCAIKVDPVPVTSISINDTSESLVREKTFQLIATPNPTNATNKAVTWTSSDPSVAMVSSTGLVTAKKIGTSTITVKSNDGSNKSKTCKITVKPVVTTNVVGIEIPTTVGLNSQVIAKALAEPAHADNAKLEWKSSSSTYATVDQNGVITGKKVGQATITAKTTDGSNKSYAFTVNVKAVAPSGLEEWVLDEEAYNWACTKSLINGLISSYYTNTKNQSKTIDSVVKSFFGAFNKPQPTYGFNLNTYGGSIDSIESGFRTSSEVLKYYYLGRAIGDGVICAVGVTTSAASITFAIATLIGGVGGGGIVGGPGGAAIGGTAVAGVVVSMAGVATVSFATAVEAGGSMVADAKKSGKEPDGKDKFKIKRSLGGSYKDLKKSSLTGEEVHHMPANSINGLAENDGPAILMEATDHRQTASVGTSAKAIAHRSQQQGLIENGHFLEAFEMDVRDIQALFGSKYNGAITQARTYVQAMISKGAI